MRIAIIGNNDGPERLAAALADSPHEITLLAVQKGARPRVPRILGNERALSEALTESRPDLVINCFANFRYTFVHHDYPVINVHLAPLPRYRGRHPLQWALINGEKTFGVTIHQINDGWDDGPIYWQRIIDVEDAWSAKELREHLFVHVEADIANLLSRLPQIKPLPNPTDQGSYVPRRYPADSLVEDWTDREYVFRKVNALRDDAHPAFAYANGRRLEFTRAHRTHEKTNAVPGTVLSTKSGEAPFLLVASSNGQTLRLALAHDRELPPAGQILTTQP